MRHARWAVSSVILATILAAPVARAQIVELRRFNVSPYAGLFVFDDQQLTDVTGVEINVAPILGARVGFAITRSWQIEAAYGFAPLSTEPSQFQDTEPDADTIADLDAHLLYGAINYLLRYRDSPTALLLGAGAGLLKLEPETETGEGTSDPVLELAAGFAHPVRDWITVRGDARDHMMFCAGPVETGDVSACPGGDETMHNFEVSAAIQFWLF